MPESDELNEGHKFPFNACEILQSENNFILDKIFESIEQIQADEETKRKLNDLSSEMYKDDLSIEDSEDSGDEQNLHANNYYKGENSQTLHEPLNEKEI